MDNKKVNCITNLIWKGYWSDKNDMEEINKIVTEVEIARFIVELKKESKEDFAIRKYDEFILAKHKYPIDVSLEWVQEWIINAFPNWLKRNKEE